MKSNNTNTPTPLSETKNISHSRFKSLQIHLLGHSKHHHPYQPSYSTTLPTANETPISIKTKKRVFIYNQNSIFNSIFSHIKRNTDELTIDIAGAKQLHQLYARNTFRSESNPEKDKKQKIKERLKQLDLNDLQLSTADNNNKQSKVDQGSKQSLPIVSVRKPKRIKTFIVKYDPKWNHIEENYNIQTNNHLFINDIEIQRNMIRDQIVLLLDNVQTYKQSFFGHNKINKVFNVISPLKQREINQTMEEIIGLMIEISYLIIMDLSQHIDKFIVNPQKRFTKADDKPVFNEIEELYSNGKLFNESSLFLKACNEVYDSTCKEETDFLFPKRTFMKVIQFLERCRSGISKLIIMTKNLYNNYQNDLSMTQKFCFEMNKIDDASRNYKSNGLSVNSNGYSKTMDKEDNEDYYCLTQKKERISYRKCKYDGGIDYTNYKGTLKVQISEEKDKINRMDKVLAKRRDDDCLEKKKEKIRKKLKVKFDINSRLIDMILKYSTAEFRNQIQSERVMMRFREKERQGINYDP